MSDAEAVLKRSAMDIQREAEVSCALSLQSRKSADEIQVDRVMKAFKLK
jgi:hypothetical protein